MQGADTDGRAPSVSPRGPLFIISGRCGRLANRLVLFANFIALAAERGYRVMNPTFHSYATLFETTRRDIYCQYPATAAPSISFPGRRRFYAEHASSSTSRGRRACLTNACRCSAVVS